MIQTAIKGKRVTLEPLGNIEYFIDLSCKENKYQESEDSIRSLISNYGGEFWSIHLNGTMRGAVGYFKFGNSYLLEALKDRNQPPTGISYSIEVGNLMLDYLFELTDKVKTFARFEDKAVQILCKKLGFKESGEMTYLGKNYITYERSR